MTRIHVAAALALFVQTAPYDRYVEVADGERLHVVDSGGGEPVVLIPGLLGSAYGFRKVIERLERERRVIVIEPLGFGASSRPRAADYSLTAQSERIDTVLQAMGVRRAVVIAHAVGASMALRLASRHAEKVAAIVSLDGGPAEAAATPGLRRAVRFSFLLRLFGGARRIRGAVRSTLRERSADPRWVTEEVVDGYMKAAGPDAGRTLQTLRDMAEAREPEPIVPRLHLIRCPVLLMVGDSAAATAGISPAEIALLSNGLDSFRVERVRNAGHFLFEEDPDAVVAAVDRAFAAAAAAPGEGR